jgi:hypothetical protein
MRRQKIMPQRHHLLGHPHMLGRIVLPEMLVRIQSHRSVTIP